MSMVTPPIRKGFPLPRPPNPPPLSFFPFSLPPPKRFTPFKRKREGGGPPKAADAGPAGQETRGGYCEGEPRLGGVGEHLGSAGQREGLERQVEVADDRVVGWAGRRCCDLDVGSGPPDTNSSLEWTAPDEVREAPIVGVAAGFGAQQPSLRCGPLGPGEEALQVATETKTETARGGPWPAPVPAIVQSWSSRCMRSGSCCRRLATWRRRSARFVTR